MSPILPFGPAGQLNPGEKLLCWRVILLGLAVTVAGLVLNFPHRGQSRDTLPIQGFGEQQRRKPA